ncbi:Importin subunit alpha-5 [Glycine max]|nr:Importin subunit alpha-5 [Glycine max]
MHMRSSRKVFVELLSKNDELRLQLEALCILTSFASGPAEHRRVIVEVGVLPQLIVFGLGIIASESPSYRDIVLDHGALSPLLHQFGKQSRLRRFATFCLCSLVHGLPPVNLEQLVNQLFPSLHKLLTSDYNKSMFKQACRTISNIIVGTRARIQTVFDANIIPYLVQSLQHAEFDVKKEAAWAIFYVTSGGSHEHIRVDECEGWDKIEKLLTHWNDEISERAARILKEMTNDGDDGSQ